MSTSYGRAPTVDPGGRWLRRFVKMASPPLPQLICFPHAGAGAITFAPWSMTLSDEVELLAVQLPGRDDRSCEPAIPDLTKLARELVDHLEPQLRSPFALFGHSMGALVTYETTVELKRRGALVPAVIVVSGLPAPHLPWWRPPLHTLASDELVEKLRRLGGLSERHCQFPRLLASALPAIQSDLAAVETYTWHPNDQLPCHIVALGGTEDALANVAELMAWQHLAGASFRMRLLPGGHFYLMERRDEFLSVLREELSPFLN